MVKITKFSTSSRQTIEYAKIIYDMYVRRELIKISETTIDNALNKNIDLPGEKIIEDSEKLLFDLAERGSFSKSFIKFDAALNQTIEMASKAFKSDEGINVLSDLMKRCHEFVTTHAKENSHESAFLEGQRSVLIFIKNMVNKKE